MVRLGFGGKLQIRVGSWRQLDKEIDGKETCVWIVVNMLVGLTCYC